MMIIRIRTALALVVASGLAACGVMPYQPASGETMVPVKVMGYGSPRICKDGKIYTPPASNAVANEVLVPAGQRLTFGAYMQQDGYNVVHYCSAWLSFVPESGQRYVSNAGMGAYQRCFVELARQDDGKETGVSLEPSLGRAACTVSR